MSFRPGVSPPVGLTVNACRTVLRLQAKDSRPTPKEAGSVVVVVLDDPAVLPGSLVAVLVPGFVSRFLPDPEAMLQEAAMTATRASTLKTLTARRRRMIRRRWRRRSAARTAAGRLRAADDRRRGEGCGRGGHQGNLPVGLR